MLLKRVGLEETNSEYMINGTALDAVDIDEFLDEVDKGTHITLYVDNKYREDKGEVDKSKTKWTYVYSAYTNDEVYFSYEDYVFYEQKDTHLAYFVSIILFILSVKERFFTLKVALPCAFFSSPLINAFR